MTDNNSKKNKDHINHEDNYNISTSNSNNLGNNFNTRFSTNENFDNTMSKYTKVKTYSGNFSSTNNNNNNNKNTVSNEYEELNIRKDIPTERCESEYVNINNTKFSHNSRAKQNMTFNNLSRENFNLNPNNQFYNTFTASNFNNNNIDNNNNNNINYNNNLYHPSSLYNSNNNYEFFSKFRNNQNPAEIAELESSKGVSSNTVNAAKTNYSPNNHFNNSDNNNNNIVFESSIASELRLSNLERRLENTEKILHFYDEMMRLKEEERRNEVRIDKNKIAELTKKINLLEENIKFLNKKINEQGELFNDKIDLVEKKFVKFIDNKNSISEYYASKLAEFENLYKKSEAFFETKIDEKISGLQNNFDAKLEDVLNLINELTLQTDKNDFNVIESRESIRNIQNDHVDFLKIVTILKEKADTLDYIMEQITDLKQRYNKIINFYGVQQIEEEDKAFIRMNDDHNMMNNLNSNFNHNDNN